MDVKTEILRLREEGKSYRQIQSELGCSKGTIAYHCGAGQKDKAKQRIRDKRNANVRYTQEFKQLKGCLDCGENYPYWMLELDHCRGEKLDNVSAMGLVTMEVLIAEIAKCDVVCANCHRIRTYNRLVSSGDSVMDLEDIYKEKNEQG